ncbi:glutamate ABC transporter substrate-binding protein [Paraburkholderia sp. JHI2823]|uniref:glutamate ABC transporter substrate-binding protein n=1 Tax=Paraburkholderia TaxID=1822464 RepID=UPI00317D99E2
MKAAKLKTIFAVLAVGLTMSALAVAETFPAGSTMEAIQKKGKFVVGTSLDGPGFSMLNPTTNKAEGFEIDIARQLARKLTGSEDNVEFVPVLSANRFAFVQTGRVDISLATATINDERKKIIGFAGPYYLAGQDVMVGKNSGIQNLSDLNGKSVCVVTGTDSAVNLLKVAPKAEIHSLTDEKSCAEAVSDGRFAALTDDGAVLVPFVKLQPDRLRLLGKPFTKEPYGVVVKHDDVQFRNWINGELEAMIKSGQWQRMYDRDLKDFGEAQVPTIERY